MDKGFGGHCPPDGWIRVLVGNAHPTTKV